MSSPSLNGGRALSNPWLRELLNRPGKSALRDDWNERDGEVLIKRGPLPGAAFSEGG